MPERMKITDREKDLSLRCKTGKEFFDRHHTEITAGGETSSTRAP